MARRIPVIVVAGFLGSGKTTLLNHLLRHNGGTRIGVVVNDFGSINIDSMLVAGQVDSMVSLGNGCLCCAVDASELDALLDRLAQPRSPVDVIVVEASGLAEPRNLIRMVVGSENPRLTYGGLVEVIDAAEFAQTRAQHPELASQLRLADLVVVNKADRVAAEDVALLVKEVVAMVGQVPVLPTANGRVDPGLLFDPPQRPRVAEQLSLDVLLCEDDDHEHLHEGYTSLSFETDEPLDARAFVALLEDPPQGLFRAKGFAAIGAERFTVHLVGRHIVFAPTSRPGGTELVFIGAGVDEVALRSRVTACVGASSESLLPVYHYVQRDPN